MITQITENEPKFDRGDKRYIRLFCLASEMLARAHEQQKSCHPDVADNDLVEEFNALNDEIKAMDMLARLSIHKWIWDRAESDHVILQIDKKNVKFELYQFDLELEASRRLLELENEFPDDDIVLVGAETVDEIVSAFRNYFNDVTEYLMLMHVATQKLKA